MAQTFDLARTREAVALRAQAHPTGCRCVICQAAAGDDRALNEVHTFMEQWPEASDGRSERP